ncbi:MAG: DUF3592 domain-containing protein, partial [Cyclobacteriaceae bacterium]
QHGATREEAEQLLKLALKESFTPVEFFKRAAKASTSHISKDKGCKQTIFGMIAFGFGFFGIPMLLAAAGIFIYQFYFISNSTRIIGTVAASEQQYNRNESSYRSVITYQINSKTYSTESNIISSTPEYYENDPVPLFVSNENPNDVFIDSFFERWLIITILGSIGLFFTLLMMVFARKSKG